MATIVQPYNDWRERAATQILAPIITGLIERGVQNERNRKMNALMAKTIQDAQPSTGLLQGQPEPEGYSSDGWANALHQNYTPLTQYDFGTQGILPMTALRKTPSITEMWSALMSNMGTKRFGMVNPQEAMQTFSPYVQASEQERMQQQRNDLADALKGKDAAAQRELMTGGAVQGIVPFSALDQMQKQYEYDNPALRGYSFNTGDTTQYGSFNPRTGQYSQQGSYENNLTPLQALENSYRDRQLNQQDKQFYAGLNEQGRQFDETQRYNRETRDLAAQAQERAREQTPASLSPAQSAQVKSYETRIKELGDQRKSLLDLRKQVSQEATGWDNEGSSDKLAEIDAELSQVDLDIANCRQQIDAIYDSVQNAGIPAQGKASGKTSYNELRGAV